MYVFSLLGVCKETRDSDCCSLTKEFQRMHGSEGCMHRNRIYSPKTVYRFLLTIVSSRVSVNIPLLHGSPKRLRSEEEYSGIDLEEGNV